MKTRGNACTENTSEVWEPTGNHKYACEGWGQNIWQIERLGAGAAHPLVMGGVIWKFAVGTQVSKVTLLFITQHCWNILHISCSSYSCHPSVLPETTGSFLPLTRRQEEENSWYLKTWWSQIKIRQLFPACTLHSAYLSFTIVHIPHF